MSFYKIYKMKPSTLQEKWGKQSLSMGWVGIPTSLLFLQSSLKITPTGMNIIINLATHWWGKDDSPYPSQASLAARMGVSERTIQREIADLVEKGIIEKKTSSATHPVYRGRNLYSLAPLAKKISESNYSIKNVKKNNQKEDPFTDF